MHHLGNGAEAPANELVSLANWDGEKAVAFLKQVCPGVGLHMSELSHSAYSVGIQCMATEPWSWFVRSVVLKRQLKVQQDSESAAGCRLALSACCNAQRPDTARGEACKSGRAGKSLSGGMLST